MQAPHETRLLVRDYECDLQGVVNNAEYMHYLEHARHEFLKSCGIDFAEVTRQGIHLVIVRAEMDFRASLAPGDDFLVLTRFEQASRLRWVFLQDIVRSRDHALMLAAKMTATALDDRGKPFVPEDLLARLG